MKVFVFNSALCNGCYNCQLACKDEHVDNDWSPISAPMPELGSFWCHIEETTHGQLPKVKVEYKPVMCAHCDNAPCIAKYPDFFIKRDDGLVILDPVKAKGHKEVMDACPYGTIWWNEDLQLAQKCTGCAHLIDEGDVPHCVDLCYTDALLFGEEEDFADVIADAETIAAPEDGARVYYINMPHLFIAGDVWDEQIDEVIEGAKVTLAGDAEAVTETDDFGDFWFRKLDAGKYTVTVEADGYEPMTKDVDLTKSLNIGDFALKATPEQVAKNEAYLASKEGAMERAKEEVAEVAAIANADSAGEDLGSLNFKKINASTAEGTKGQGVDFKE